MADVLNRWPRLSLVLRAVVSGTVFGLLWKVLGSGWTAAIFVGAGFGVFTAAARHLGSGLSRRSAEHDARVKEQGTEHEWISAGEIAQLLGVREDWVWTMAARGEIPSVKIEHGLRGIFQTSRRFRRGEVEAWMRASAKQ